MKNKKISVIVPVYNTEKYLSKCIESILNQTYYNLEIILVNDGSIDASLSICHQYEKDDARVTVIDKKNGGLSSARNAGLEIASGCYIAFVDSDDYLDNQAYTILYDTLIKNHADIAIMKYIQVDGIYRCITEIAESSHDTISRNGNWFLKGICQRKLSCSVCDKLFRSELFINRRFDESRLNEDFLLLSEMLIGNVEIAITDYYGYYYYTRLGSISHSGFGKSVVDAVYNTTKVKKMSQKYAPELVPIIGAFAAYQARTALILIPFEEFQTKNSFVVFCEKTIRDNRKYIATSFMNTKDKLFCYMYLACPLFTKKISDRIYRGHQS